jgi:uncharacterized protein YcbK (DUF882 family)
LPQTASAASTRDRKACRTLGAIGAATLALTLSTTGLQDVIANGDTRTLSFFHTHSKESLTVTFKVNGRYDEAALAKINHFLRDWRNHQQTKMNPHLFDILWEVNRDTGGKEPIQIISAYRSPETNSMLRSRSSGVAKFSQHIQGNAIDFRIPGVSLADLRAAGLRLQRGGVGFYPGSDFVHMDTSTIRHWPRMTRDQLARVFPDGKTVHVPTDGVPLKNYQIAAAELQQRGQFGERPATQIASAAPDQNGLQRFISSLFGSNSVANTTLEADEEEAPQQQAQPRTQVASVNQLPRAKKERLQWNQGPAAVNVKEEPSEEVTGSTSLAYAAADQRQFPAIDAQAQRVELDAVPLAAGADQAPFTLAFANPASELRHPRNEQGFAAPVRAAVANSFAEFAPEQLGTERFQKQRPPVNVIGFAPLPTRAAAR